MVHNPKPNGPLQVEKLRQRPIPPWRFPEPRTSTCRCGRAIRESCWGWIHTDTVWISSGECRSAAPRHERSA